MSDIKKKKVKMLTYGCQMNFSDAERMTGELARIGYEETEDMNEADLIMINTCAVRETAEDKVYGKIGEIKGLKRQNPNLILGITGCMAQKEGEKLIKRAPHIDFVLGTNKIQQVVATVQALENEEYLLLMDNGHYFSFYSDEAFEIGTIVNVIFDYGETDKIEDDIIIAVSVDAYEMAESLFEE